MPDYVETEAPAPSMAQLVGGIVQDAQALVRQELALARREIQEEFVKARTAAVSFGVGAAVTLLGGLFLLLCVAFALHEVAGLPLWGSFLIVGGVLFVVGAVLFFVAYNRASDINFVPRQTVDSMRENVEWIRNQT